MPISACPARRRPYCAVSDRPRHHHYATTAPLVSPRFPRRKNGCRRRARRAGGVEEGALSGTIRSLPRVAGERKKVEVPSRVRTNASVYCRTYCCTVVAHSNWGCFVGGRVGGWTGGCVVSYVGECFRAFGRWPCSCFWCSMLCYVRVLTDASVSCCT